MTDREILAAYRRVAREGLFAEPASAASVAGLLHLHADGSAPAGRHRRLRADRPRAEGPGVGDRRRLATRDACRPIPPPSPRSSACDAVKLTARAPATSANLGPGFDCFGLALDLWNEVHGRHRRRRRASTWEGEGAGELPDRRHRHGVEGDAPRGARGRRRSCPRVALHGVNRIPLERGLGSSAAACVAGIIARRPPARPRVWSPRTCSSSRPRSRAIPTTPPPRSPADSRWRSATA